MVANSLRNGSDSASLRPWLLASLLAHAALLGPSAPPPAPIKTTPSMPLQWRLLAPTATGDPIATPAQSAGRVATPPPQAAAPAPLKQMPLPPSATWSYQLRWRGETGQAWLSWQQNGQRYQLQLHRRTPERELPSWLSEGRLDAQQGLRPLRFSTQGARGERPLPLPDGDTQDRLSWMLQAAALAADRGLRPGGRLLLQVASWRGETQTWLLLAERDEQAPGLLRLRRLPPEGSPLEQLLWLDPARHYRPVRMRLRYDEADRWELIADDAPAAR